MPTTGLDIFYRLFLFQKSLTSLFGSQQPSKNMSNTVDEATFDIEPYKLHLLEEGPPQVLLILRLSAIMSKKEFMDFKNIISIISNLFSSVIDRHLD